jgi:Uma2 family endonuclease
MVGGDLRVTLRNHAVPMTDAGAYIPLMAPATMTAEDLLRLNIQDKRSELVRGQLVVREPAGLAHGVVASRIGERVAGFVRVHALGLVVAAETGFMLALDPDTVRAPDVGFIRRDRVPDPLPRGYASIAPDLVVEVLSPDDRPGEVLAKVADWLRAGTRLVWVVDPIRRAARVYRADGTEAFATGDDSLDGEDVLPGFVLPLAAIL